ncbi:MAG: tyrosine-type recombinase/integrase [Candidatus Cybelea sp.]
MEGHLYKRGRSKTWYLLYDLPKAHGDKRKQCSVRIGKMPKSHAEARKREILRRVDQGTWQSAPSLTVEKFLRLWLDATRPRLAAKTHERYSSLVQLYVLPVIGQLRLGKVEPKHLRQLYQSIIEKGLSKQTALHVHRALHTAFAYGVREERILGENIVSLVKAPQPDARTPMNISREQVRAVILAAKGGRLKIPVILAATTGLRRGELLALRWSDVDLDHASVHVLQALEQTRTNGVRVKSPKSRSSRRLVPIAPECVEMLRKHKAEQGVTRTPEYSDNDLVMPNTDGSPWPPDNFSAQFSKLARTAGCRGFRFHDLRHAFATLTLSSGTSIKDVQNLLGHSSASLTLSTYAHVLEGAGRAAVNRLGSSLLGSSEVAGPR